MQRSRFVTVAQQLQTVLLTGSHNHMSCCQYEAYLRDQLDLGVSLVVSYTQGTPQSETQVHEYSG